MTPLDIARENARREREAKRKARKTLPPRQPAPESAKAEIERIPCPLGGQEAMSMPGIPEDYAAIWFGDQGLGLDLSRGRQKPRKAKPKPKAAPELSAAELRYLQVDHVITRMRAENGRPATFIWPEAA